MTFRTFPGEVFVRTLNDSTNRRRLCGSCGTVGRVRQIRVRGSTDDYSYHSWRANVYDRRLTFGRPVLMVVDQSGFVGHTPECCERVGYVTVRARRITREYEKVRYGGQRSNGNVGTNDFFFGYLVRGIPKVLRFRSFSTSVRTVSKRFHGRCVIVVVVVTGEIPLFGDRSKIARARTGRFRSVYDDNDNGRLISDLTIYGTFGSAEHY